MQSTNETPPSTVRITGLDRAYTSAEKAEAERKAQADEERMRADDQRREVEALSEVHYEQEREWGATDEEAGAACRQRVAKARRYQQLAHLHVSVVYRAPTPRPCSTRTRTGTRARGAGRPRARRGATARAPAASGDPGPSAGGGDPPPPPPSDLAVHADHLAVVE